MNNATTKKISAFILAAIIAVGVLQPMTASFADLCGDDIYISDEQADSAAETFEAVCENFPLTEEKVPDAPISEQCGATEDIPENDTEEAQEELPENVIEEIPDDAPVCKIPEEFPVFEEENAKDLIENEVQEAESENEIEAVEEFAEESFSVELGALAAIRPDAKYHEDPDGRPGDRHLIDSKTEEKILETVSHAIPFGSTIYHVVRHLSGKDSNPSKVAEDVASEAVSLALDTLCPGSSSIFSVFKDLAKKLLPTPNRS